MNSLFLSALMSVGQATPATEAPAATPQPVPVVYKAVTVLDLEGGDVTATVSHPEIVSLRERQAAKFPPMFTVRTNFDDELRESIEDVK